MRDVELDEGSGAVVGRRLVLAAVGVTLLAGCTSSAERLTSTARTSQARPGAKAAGGIQRSAPPGPGGQGSHSGTPGGLDRFADRPEFTVRNGPQAIALTIDDGPDARYTPQVLAVLQRYNVTATFSMIGRQVAELPGLAREVSAAGHQISNHTWRHRNLQAMAASAALDEMDRATDAIQSQVGLTPRYFRAPYGAWTRAVLRRCVAQDMLPLDWSVDPKDWARPGVSYIVRDILRHTRTGSIILEHDGGGNRAQTVAALGIVIPRLLEAGYRFTTP